MILQPLLGLLVAVEPDLLGSALQYRNNARVCLSAYEFLKLLYDFFFFGERLVIKGLKELSKSSEQVEQRRSIAGEMDGIDVRIKGVFFDRCTSCGVEGTP